MTGWWSLIDVNIFAKIWQLEGVKHSPILVVAIDTAGLSECNGEVPEVGISEELPAADIANIPVVIAVATVADAHLIRACVISASHLGLAFATGCCLHIQYTLIVNVGVLEKNVVSQLLPFHAALTLASDLDPHMHCFP